MFEAPASAKVFDKTVGDSIPMPANKITLFIDQMEDGDMIGYSVCAGNDRPFRGVYTQEGEKTTATLKEPGDNKYDGTFQLVISKNPLSITGKWILTVLEVKNEQLIKQFEKHAEESYDDYGRWNRRCLRGCGGI